VDPTLERLAGAASSSLPQGRVAAPPGADGRGQTVPGYLQPLTPSVAFGDTSP
jgi:hypothetical protein